ncbi:glutathione S-transferase family protein [Beijerinckia indica]|uniref:Glutathione S-transferase domain n=1 Tax=Beijerinckia indica subsp. indica (strain ATCC 9039 / DSM 1715 / NCIMB 8712) TaxID=395963 RepID=B2IEI9_BEII9|nr:glutathione S-transferase family protein [Beijerinckia indica]ACB95582.1 Glutathione S-transferase domain [Beijerinckia indica subsp. indica ATCC 9039]
MNSATLTISSKNYSSWSLRGWLLTKFAGLPFAEKIISPDDPAMRAELLLLSPSFLVPCLTHEGIKVWDTLAIGEYLNEIKPEAHLLPEDRMKRTHCRSICGEMHSGFFALRSALPVNLKGDFPNFKVWERAQADIDRIAVIWRNCLTSYGGPFLMGERSMADAMYAPVVTRFLTYHVTLDSVCSAYCQQIIAMPEMIEWTEAARLEPEEIVELDAEF